MSKLKATIRANTDNHVRVTDTPEIAERVAGVAEYSFKQGVQYGANLCLRAGYVLEQISDKLTPAQLKECREIFALNKEIADESNS